MESQKKISWWSVSGWVLAILFVVGFVFYVRSLRTEIETLKQTVSLDSAFKEKMKVEYNYKEKSFEYSKSVLVSEKKVLDDYLKKNDSALYSLRKYNKGSISGSIVSTESKIDTVVVTKVSEDIRTADIRTDYYTANVKSTVDSTYIKVRMVDSLKISMGEDYRIRVTNRNKNVDIVDVNSFYVKPPPQKRKSWKYIAGAIAGLGTGYLIFK